MNLEKVIEQMGFSKNEAKVYLAVLSLGECHVSDLVEVVKLPRSSIHAILEKLRKQGLMNFYMMRRDKFWVAEAPERILSTIQKKEERIKEALPKLAALRKGKKRNKDSNSVGLFKMLADAMPQPVLIANGDIEITYVNAAWENEFGYMLDEVIGQNPSMLKSGKTDPHIYKKMWQALNSERLFQTDEIIDKRKDGTHINLLTTIFPVRHDGNVFFIQVLNAMSDKKKTEELKRYFS